MGGKVYAKDCPLRHCEAHTMLPSLLSPPQLRHCEIPLTDYFVIARNERSMSSFVRHCEKSFSFSWQSINLHTLRFTTSVIARLRKIHPLCHCEKTAQCFPPLSLRGMSKANDEAIHKQRKS